MKTAVWSFVIFSFLFNIADGFSKGIQKPKPQTNIISPDRELILLVNDAANNIRSNGENAFREFEINGSRWRKGETYVFVLDPDGVMLVHEDSSMVGKNVIDLKDVNGQIGRAHV